MDIWFKTNGQVETHVLTKTQIYDLHDKLEDAIRNGCKFLDIWFEQDGQRYEYRLTPRQTLTLYRLVGTSLAQDYLDNGHGLRLVHPQN